MTALSPRPALGLLYSPGKHTAQVGTKSAGSGVLSTLGKCVHGLPAAFHPGGGPSRGVSYCPSLELVRHKCAPCPRSAGLEPLHSNFQPQDIRPGLIFSTARPQLTRHAFLALRPLPICRGSRSPSDSESQGLSLGEASDCQDGQIRTCKWLFNNREWPSFALAAENFLKMVPKPLEARTCAGMQAQEWRRRAMSRKSGGGLTTPDATELGTKALGLNQVLWAASHCPSQSGQGLGKCKEEH